MSDEIEWKVIQVPQARRPKKKATPRPKRRKGYKGRIGTAMLVERRPK
jgi:hypothetical protein